MNTLRQGVLSAMGRPVLSLTLFRSFRTRDMAAEGVGVENFHRRPRPEISHFQVHMGSYSRRLSSTTRRWWKLGALLLAAAVLLSFFRRRVPYTVRSQFFLPFWFDSYIGEQAYGQLSVVAVPEHHALTREVMFIVARILSGIAVGQAENPQLAEFLDMDWSVVVCHASEVNAFCLPGGKVMITTGMLEAVNLRPQVAFLLGHEIAHALARHSTERLLLTKIVGLSMKLLDGYVSPGDYTDMFFALPWNRASELEADAIGLKLALKAGYDVTEEDIRGIFDAFDMLERKSGPDKGKVPEWFLTLRHLFSTHPSNADRARRLCEQLPVEVAQVVPLPPDYKCTHAARYRLPPMASVLRLKEETAPPAPSPTTRRAWPHAFLSFIATTFTVGILCCPGFETLLA